MAWTLVSRHRSAAGWTPRRISPNSPICFTALIRSVPETARPTTCAPDCAARTMWLEKSVSGKGARTEPTTSPPSARTISVPFCSSEWPKA
jgi:hypothetical protein